MEASFCLITLDYGLTLDELLCSPEAVAEFDKMATEFSPGFKPFHYRWAALFEETSYDQAFPHSSI